jgi:predicted TIM-barrel fold metal-dependent hydrolase
LRRNYLTEDYLAAAEGLNIAKCVYMEVDVTPAQQVAEAEYVIELCRAANNPTLAGVISGRCEHEQFESYIKRYKESPYIKGVRRLLQDTPRGLCLDRTFVKSVRLLGQLNMSFDLTIRPAELADALQLVKQCPETRFVVDHCGTADVKAFLPSNSNRSHDPDAWKRDISRLAEQPNTICKISGIVASAPSDWRIEHLSPIVEHCLDAFGMDRVVFGGDWPVCLLGATLRQWVEALKEIIRNRPFADQRKLFYENAVRFYGLA